MDVNLKIMMPVAAALVSASVLFIIRGIAFRLLHRWAGKTETKVI
ncbi:MAG: hypothetical protein U0937_00905 [Thermodesulfovibrionia bacterium]|nr:hypothetical protein [Thermodesulfovibrionia bacterium]